MKLDCPRATFDAFNAVDGVDVAESFLTEGESLIVFSEDVYPGKGYLEFMSESHLHLPWLVHHLQVVRLAPPSVDTQNQFL